MATLSQQCCPVPSSDSILYMFMYCLPRYCDIDVLVLAVKPMVNSKGVTESPAMIQIDTRYSIHYYPIDNNQSVFIAVLRIRSIIVLATASAGL